MMMMMAMMSTLHGADVFCVLFFFFGPCGGDRGNGVSSHVPMSPVLRASNGAVLVATGALVSSGDGMST